jgi:hypothetical protein
MPSFTASFNSLQYENYHCRGTRLREPEGRTGRNELANLLGSSGWLCTKVLVHPEQGGPIKGRGSLGSR